MDGFINLYKEPGYTSFDCVAILRRILKQRKIGHMGTLDPDAEGVLPVAAGRATKLIELFENEKKTYEAVMLLGITTDTLDTSGTVLEERPVECSAEDVQKALLSFKGEISQIPPMYSAVKIGGRKLYELARQGIEVERRPRNVTVYEISVTSVSLPRVTFTVTCSKGTYIRTLIDDCGRLLGCGACMEHLVRTEASGFYAEDAHTLGEIENMCGCGDMGFLVPMERALGIYERVQVPAGCDRTVRNGGRLRPEDISYKGAPGDDLKITVFDSEGCLIGLYEYRAADECFIPRKMLYDGN